MPLLPPSQQLLAELKLRCSRLSRNPGAYRIELCKLCRRPSVTFGLFVPLPDTDLAQWIGTPPKGKLRALPYGLCEHCLSLGKDEWNESLEQTMREEFHPTRHRQAYVKHAVDFDIPAADLPQEAHTQLVPEEVTTGSWKTRQKPVVLQPTPNPKKQYTEALAMVREHRREFGMEHCTLCGRRAENVCMFLPDEGTAIAERIGLPHGKTRGILYALCLQCLSLPSKERMLRVELWIMQTPRITLAPELPEL
jgi:hypothetical protein